MSATLQLKPINTPVQPCRNCTDHDEECDDIADKVACWLYDPNKGMCPYLKATKEQP